MIGICRNVFSYRAIGTILTLTALLMMSACAPKLPMRIGPQTKVMATDAEIELGRAVHPEILNQFGRYDDEVLQGYVQRIGEQLVLANFGAERIFRFTVLDSDDVNAFSIPGGYIYITRGLLALLNSEPELAAILAHEIAHVTERHAAHHLSETELGENQLVVGSVVIHSVQSQAAVDLFKTMGTTLLDGYEPEEEIDASLLSATFLAAAGYNPVTVGSVRAFLRRHAEFDRQLAIEENRRPHVYHGVGHIDFELEKQLHDATSKIKFKERTSDAIENLDRFFNSIDGLIWGDSAQQGLIVGRQLLNAELGIALTAPDGWRVYNQNSRVLWLPASHDAYLELDVHELKAHVNPQDFTRNGLALQEITDGAVFSPNGLSGYTAVAKLRTPYGYQRGRVYVIFANERAFVLQSAGRTETVRAFYNDQLWAAVSSFRVLTPDEKSKVRPRKVKVVVVDKGATFESLVQKSTLGSRVREQLRLINQLYPTGQLRPGQRVKLVE